MRRLVLVALWSIATVVAIVVAWRGVAVVADTGERRQRVATAAAPAPPLSDSSGTTSSPTPPSTATSVPATAPTSPVSGGETRVAEAIGGTAAVQFNGDGTTELLWAQPADGFTMEVESSGPSGVEVQFERDDHESRVKAEWRDGAPDVRIEERAG